MEASGCVLVAMWVCVSCCESVNVFYGSAYARVMYGTSGSDGVYGCGIGNVKGKVDAAHCVSARVKSYEVVVIYGCDSEGAVSVASEAAVGEVSAAASWDVNSDEYSAVSSAGVVGFGALSSDGDGLGFVYVSHAE